MGQNIFNVNKRHGTLQRQRDLALDCDLQELV